MVKKRGHGERGSSVFSELDYVLLKELYKTKKEYSVTELRDRLNLANLSTRRHINWLVKLDFISRTKVPKSNRAILKITEQGKKVYELFEKVLPKAKK